MGDERTPRQWPDGREFALKKDHLRGASIPEPQTVTVAPAGSMGLALSPTGTVDPSLLTGFPNAGGVYLDGAGHWTAVSSGATVATTVSGLGTATNGKVGLVRAGSSLYEEVLLVYDSTKAKWVSAAETFTGPLSSTANAFVGNQWVIYAVVPGWAALVTAAVSMEARATGWLVSNQNNASGGWTFNVQSQASGTVTHPSSGGTVLASSSAGTTGETWFDSGWLAANPATADHAVFSVGINAGNTGQTSTCFMPQITVRFVG